MIFLRHFYTSLKVFSITKSKCSKQERKYNFDFHGFSLIKLFDVMEWFKMTFVGIAKKALELLSRDVCNTYADSKFLFH